MSDVMPYLSTRFSAMTREQIGRYFAAWMSQIRRAIDEFQPQIIHSHHVWVMSSLLKSVDSSIPVVTHFHGTGLRQMELCPALAEEVRSGCSRNDAFVALHQGHAPSLQTQLGVDPDRISVVGSGFREDIFHDRGRSRTGPVVTYAGKLGRAKGLPWLIEAVEPVAVNESPMSCSTSRVRGAAPKPTRSADRSTGAILRAYHGQVDQNRLAALLRESAVFALPSFFEGLPLVLRRGRGMGCRLVATSLPGVVDELQPQLGGASTAVPLPRLANIDQPGSARPAGVHSSPRNRHRRLAPRTPYERCQPIRGRHDLGRRFRESRGMSGADSL